MGNEKLEQQKIGRKPMTEEEFNDLLDETIIRKRGIPTVEEDGTEVCVVSVFKSKDIPDVTFPMVTRKISRELLQQIKIEEDEYKQIDYRYCLNCGKQFETKRWNKKYCSKKCRSIYRYPKTKKQIIDAMREDYLRIKERNPAKAQEIADEMEITEGKKFRDLALDGLAPFNNPKKYDKKRNIIRSR